jgi:hypothetical protein
VVDFGGLHENNKPGGHHLSEEGGYLWGCDEVSLFCKYILMAIVSVFLVGEGLLPIIWYFKLSTLIYLFNHKIAKLIGLFNQIL